MGYCRAVLAMARIGNPRRCRYDPTCSTAAETSSGPRKEESDDFARVRLDA